jgi:alpha,alpha-trehalose-phosphate synthase [UDP-forming]
VRAAAGGLVTALRPALESRGGSWVGWGGGAEVPRRAPGLDVDLFGVHLSRREVEDYYHGFSNRTLWPLLHGWLEPPVFELDWWRTYRRVNERFAAVELPPHDGPDPILWVHDYQLMLVPALLRAKGRRGLIGFFLHIPFPAAELFARLPWRVQLLEGLLGADVVSFQTGEYRDNFLEACRRLEDLEVVGSAVVLGSGRRVEVTATPISIDAADFARRATSPGVERALRQLRAQFAGRRVMVGVDRLDYTKGILERLRAFELLLEQRPHLRGTLAFLQVAVPSRGEVREYRELRQQVEQLVGHVNGRFTEPGHDVPVHYLYRGVTADRLLAYYRLADVGLVTPLRDGMNLVAKEFVVVQDACECGGALVLSEFTGAASELLEALPCNPFDLEAVAGSIELALELDLVDRRRRLRSMAGRVHEHDVYWWADRELEAIEAVGRRSQR